MDHTSYVVIAFDKVVYLCFGNLSYITSLYRLLICIKFKVLKNRPRSFFSCKSLTLMIRNKEEKMWRKAYFLAVSAQTPYT